jgi:AcrR family transcriptional regulator
VVDRRRSDTRLRIQRTALEMFAEQGYDQASLRKIAERLGVTQAALYYHFKTKEEIVASVVDDLGDSVEELASWGRAQPASAETRDEVLRRLSTLLNGPWHPLMRFAEENRPALRTLPIGERINGWMRTVLALLIDPTAGPVEQFRARLAVASLLMGHAAPADIDASAEEQAAIALDVARELVRGASGSRG